MRSTFYVWWRCEERSNEAPETGPETSSAFHVTVDSRSTFFNAFADLKVIYFNDINMHAVFALSDV